MEQPNALTFMSVKNRANSDYRRILAHMVRSTAIELMGESIEQSIGKLVLNNDFLSM